MVQRVKAGEPGVEDIVSAAVAGLSNAQIARHFHCTTDAVRAAMDQHAAEILKPAARASLLALQIAKMQQLQAHFTRYAIENNDATAGTLCVKISQRLAALTGIDQPAAIRMDITHVHENEDSNKTRTERALEVLRQLRESDPHRAERDAFNEMLRQRDEAALRIGNETEQPPDSED